jgi:uncharacterized protein YjiS (DUF1127 family)
MIMSFANLFAGHETIGHRARRDGIGIADLPARAWRAVTTWIDRAQQRSALDLLDDRLLADAGLTRAQIALEARRPLWSLDS